MNYQERKEAIEKSASTATTDVATLLADIAWILCDVAESLDNIRQNGIQVETSASRNQPFP